MTLKQKSVVIFLGVFGMMAVVFGVIISDLISSRYQLLENQKVEMDLTRIKNVYQNEFTQIANKLSDWTNWDDTYKFISDGNQVYVKSNLVAESFGQLGVDEALFYTNNDVLVASLYTKGADNLASFFATGSSLFRVDENSGNSGGLLKTDKGLLLYEIAKVYKSDNSGPANGWMVFGKYFDDTVLASIKDLTQSNLKMVLWNQSGITEDYLPMESGYLQGKKELVKILDKNTISGYVVLEDVFGKAQAILRTDVHRDISLQGTETIKMLMVGLGVVGIVMIISNYLLINELVLKRIYLIAKDVDTLAKSGQGSRLIIIKGDDELGKLRAEINEMLDSLETERQKGESLIDLVNAMVVVLDAEGKIVMINKKGLELLGYQNEEVIGKDWQQTFIPTEMIKNVGEVFKKVSSGVLEDVSEVENKVLTKSGEEKLINWHNTIVRDSQGKVLSTISLGEDITFKKKEEKKKEEYNREMERLNRIMVDRELKMVELKKQIRNLEKSGK